MQLAMGARQGTEAEDLTSTLVRLGARKLIEELLEAETSDILGGRGRYERRHAGQQGLRNGYKRRHIDCAEGRLEIEVPQIRGVQGVCLLSHASVSRLSEQLWEEYEAFSERDLSGFDVVYLFADGVYESVRQECLKLVFAVLWRASARWRGVRFSELEQKQLENYLETRKRLQQADQRLADLSQREKATA